MKTKKEIFSFGLYKEGLRRTRIMTAIFTTIGCLIVIIVMVAKAAINIRGYGIDTPVVKEQVTVSDFYYVLIILYILVAPVLTYTMFSFLNKRRTSDFFHSIPHTRISVFLSFVSALITQLIVYCAAIALTAGATLLIFINRLSFDMLSLLPYLLTYFAAALLVSAVIILAMSISGRLFNSVILSLMILIVPGSLIYIYASCFKVLLPMIYDTADLMPISGGLNNIVLLDLIRMLDSANANSREGITTVLPLVYTIVLALIYLTLAAVIFCKRKSETAGAPAPSGKVQSLLRLAVFCAPSFVVTLILVSYLISINRDSLQGIANKNYTLLYIIAYTACVLVAMIYELISTKRWKNLKRILPTIGIALILNVVIGLGAFAAYQVELNFAPSAEEIDSISLVTSYGGYYSKYSDRNLKDYRMLDSENIIIEDPEIIMTVSEALRKEIKHTKTIGNIYYMGTSAYSDPFGEHYTRIIVRFRTGLVSKNRVILVKENIASKINDQIVHSGKYEESMRTLPKLSGGRLEFIGYLYNRTFYSGNITYYRDQIFSILAEEMKTVDYDKWLELQSQLSNASCEGTLSYATTHNGKNTYVSIRVSEELTPKTFKFIRSIRDAFILI